MVLFNIKKVVGGTVVLFNIRRWSGVRWFFLIRRWSGVRWFFLT